MEVKWLVENYESDNSLRPLINEIKKQGMRVEVVKYEPWESGEFNQYSDEDCVVFYGTLNLGRQLQREKRWIPGVYCNRQNLSCITYYSYWAKYLLNENYMMIPILDIKRVKDVVFNTMGIDDCIFIRPNSGSKTFTGRILKKEEVDQELHLLGNYAGKPLDKIIAVISSPKIINKEWRCVVVNKKVIAFSQYMANGELNVKKEIDTDAFCFADRIAKEEWQPDITYTLDICESNKGYYLLEVNSFSCSGLYDCNPEPVVREVSKAALREWVEYNEF